MSATSTNMSCVPGDLIAAAAKLRAAAPSWAAEAPGWYPRCDDAEILPCFLAFADYDTPRSDFSNMRCFPVNRKPAALVERDCPGGQAVPLDAADDEASQVWELSPSYYQFRGCKCLAGYREVWSRNDTHLQCELVPRSAALPAWAYVFVALGVVLALLAAAIALVGSRWVLFRSRWAREMELKRKRAKGLPKSGGAVSIVVTDIEGYSGARLGGDRVWVFGPFGRLGMAHEWCFLTHTHRHRRRHQRRRPQS